MLPCQGLGLGRVSEDTAFPEHEVLLVPTVSFCTAPTNSQTLIQCHAWCVSAPYPRGSGKKLKLGRPCWTQLKGSPRACRAAELILLLPKPTRPFPSLLLFPVLCSDSGCEGPALGTCSLKGT